METKSLIDRLWEAEINSKHRYCSGHIAIAHREEGEPACYAINKSNYKLNGKCDGWFRKIEGLANGYGLAINSIKITSRTPLLVGNFLTYKAVIQYTANDETPATDKFWVFVEKSFDIEEVLEYIQENQHKWFP